MKDLRKEIIKLAHQNPELRSQLLPLVHQAAVGPRNPAERKLADELDSDPSTTELVQMLKDKPSQEELTHSKVDAAGWKRAVTEALRMSREKSKKNAGLKTAACQS